MGQNGGGWGKAGVGKDADVTASASGLDRHLHFSHVHLPGPQDLSNLVLPREGRSPTQCACPEESRHCPSGGLSLTPRNTCSWRRPASGQNPGFTLSEGERKGAVQVTEFIYPGAQGDAPKAGSRGQVTQTEDLEGQGGNDPETAGGNSWEP